ncbi:DUF914-domain-containing protein [Choiromyces venosus 120613-1]|uniref:DUF914-domain-containing protein n=1 Tax=Choiromyces venosus 120613-1 TaxID=1336337 RepID=A0A3N4K6Q6_9PEZI|nr:DUF914-domain-containing protein [Choiromyces venosus 120613-1]
MPETRKNVSALAIHPQSEDPSTHRSTVPANTEDAAELTFVPSVKEGKFAFLTTLRFYEVLVMGQILALCLVSTNTLSGLLVKEGTSIPAFQSFFNYVLLNLVYTSYTLYKYGFKKWTQVILKDGWKYFILAFLDVEGNYFAVLAYRYTTILSAQLINFWAIVVVVILSFLFLRVRYGIPRIAGILICCGGMGVLLASDSMHGSAIGGMPTELKGDLFMLLGATMYGFSNVAEEFLVSKKPLFEVVGQLAFWGMLINGTQAGIFDRDSFRSATWNGKVGGYMVGYTLSLFIFYTIVPILLRMASAAFFNISLLTTNFWGVLIGIRVFGYVIHKLYPVAFVMIILGLIIYFAFQNSLGEAQKPWLGLNQEKGIAGIGTAKKRKVKVDIETGTGGSSAQGMTTGVGTMSDGAGGMVGGQGPLVFKEATA